MGTRLLAATAPLAATAGSPIPGNVESPQQRSPGICVFWNGNVPSPALMPGPYVPQCRLRNCRCVNGVPTFTQTDLLRFWTNISKIVNKSELVSINSHHLIHCWHGEQKVALAQAWQLTGNTRRHRYAHSNQMPVLSLDISMIASIFLLLGEIVEQGCSVATSSRSSQHTRQTRLPTKQPPLPFLFRCAS